MKRHVWRLLRGLAGILILTLLFSGNKWWPSVLWWMLIVAIIDFAVERLLQRE